MTKEAQMLFECCFRLPVFAGLLEHLKTGDDASLHLIKGDQPSELDFRSAFMARNDARMRFKQAEHLLFGRDLLALEHSAARLSDHAPHQREELLHLLTSV